MGYTGRGTEAVENVDNSRVESFLKKSMRNVCASRIRDGSLKFADLLVVYLLQATPTTEAPTPAGFLPLRCDILDLLEQKITSDKHWEARAGCHSKVRPSGLHLET